MSEQQSISLPAATVQRLEALLMQRDAVSAVIEATVQTAREALGVPEGHQLRSVREGFVATQEQAGQAAGE